MPLDNHGYFVGRLFFYRGYFVMTPYIYKQKIEIMKKNSNFIIFNSFQTIFLNKAIMLVKSNSPRLYNGQLTKI